MVLEEQRMREGVLEFRYVDSFQLKGVGLELKSRGYVEDKVFFWDFCKVFLVFYVFLEGRCFLNIGYFLYVLGVLVGERVYFFAIVGWVLFLNLFYRGEQ